MEPSSGTQPKRSSLCWNRILVHAKRKLYRPSHNKPVKKQNIALKSREGTERLGKFAQENQIPSCLRHYIVSRGQNSKDGVLPLLNDLLKANTETHSAYLCHWSVCRITKLRHEGMTRSAEPEDDSVRSSNIWASGSFCGYRNIQMLISHLIMATKSGPRVFPDGIPGIFQLQDRIEEAWDKGYNTRGRIETGGIKGTRKFIGTPEAQALFLSLNIKCSAQRFQDLEARSAVDQLADALGSYFQRSYHMTSDKIKVQDTKLPPVYFQRPGHSMTIVGLEETADRERHLIVFNPGRRYRDDAHPTGSLSTGQKQAILESYRLRLDSLRKYNEFELL